MAGFYIITNAASGAAMIGSTAAGASAAGTVGIIGGTAGAAGTTAAIVSAPVTITVAVLAALGLAASEGMCYFTDERITDYGQILSIMEKIDEVSVDGTFFLSRNTNQPAYIMIDYDGAGMTLFRIKDLYIVNGELINRDWFTNTSIGNIAVSLQATKTDVPPLP